MDASLLFPDAQIQAIALQAAAALPRAVNGRIEKAVRLVQSASVELHADGSATVLSETDGLTGYRIAHQTCTCEDFKFQPAEVGGWCCHRIARALVLRLQQQHATPIDVTPEAVPLRLDVPVVDVPPSGPSAIPDFVRPHVVYIQGRPFVKFAGLLALAHDRGLVHLKAHFISVTSELALADAEATFADGRTFSECGDATPANVGPKVKAHFARMALTRAKARCLRDALNVGLCSLEELEQE
jgi:hypothetical protein